MSSPLTLPAARAFRAATAIGTGTYHGLQDPDLKLRKVHADVDLDTLKKAMNRNGRDEIVFETDEGRMFVLDAVRLENMGDTEPGVGDRLIVGDLEGAIRHLDIERRSDFRGIALTLTGLIVGASIGGAAGLMLAATSVPLGMIGGGPAHKKRALDAVGDVVAESRHGSMSALDLMIRERSA